MEQNRCEACHAGMPTYAKDQILEHLKNLDDWTYDEDRVALVRTFKFKGFYKTMAFVNAVAWIAQQQGHHPDMQVSYNQVVVAYQTHEAQGITNNDLICAHLVSDLLDSKS